jgi:hypothetical protein
LSHKSLVKGFRAQLEVISEITGWDTDELELALDRAIPGADHDRLDAFASAWVASLPTDREGHLVYRTFYGSTDNPFDQIWIPFRNIKS